MPFPQVPFTAVVRSGAKVWNQWGLITWGTTAEKTVTVVALFGNKARIGNPLWNGRKWSVLQNDITIVPPVEPPAGVTKTHTIEVFSDGSITIDGLPYS